jgi:hypothetical protein
MISGARFESKPIPHSSPPDEKACDTVPPFKLSSKQLFNFTESACKFTGRYSLFRQFLAIISDAIPFLESIARVVNTDSSIASNHPTTGLSS